MASSDDEAEASPASTSSMTSSVSDRISVSSVSSVDTVHIFQIRKATLISESGYFKAMLRNEFEETKRGEIELHEDDPQSIQKLLAALTTTHPVAFVRKFWEDKICYTRKYSLNPGRNHLLSATLLYIATDKYDMHNLHELVVNFILPGICAAYWSREGQFVTSFLSNHFEVVKNTYAEYPKDLWPLFGNAVVHHQRSNPASMLLHEMLFETPEMARQVYHNMTEKLVFQEDRAAVLLRLKDQIEEMNETAKSVEWSQRRGSDAESVHVTQ